MFTGWLRIPHGRWRVACEAPTWAACWDLLLAVRPKHLPSLEKVVLKKGISPDRGSK